MRAESSQGLCFLHNQHLQSLRSPSLLQGLLSSASRELHAPLPQHGAAQPLKSPAEAALSVCILMLWPYLHIPRVRTREQSRHIHEYTSSSHRWLHIMWPVHTPTLRCIHSPLTSQGYRSVLKGVHLCLCPICILKYNDADLWKPHL